MIVLLVKEKIQLWLTNAIQKHLGCKKGEANQKQYSYLTIHVTKSFDIS